MAEALKYTFLEKVMNDYGRDLAKELQSIVPVKTGALKQSIDFKGLIKTTTGFEIDLEALYYFEFLDQGTKFIVPRHYLIKAKETLSKKYSNLIAEAAGKDFKVSLIKELKLR